MVLEELSFLFNCLIALKLDYPERRLNVRKSIALYAMSGALVTTLENPSKSLILTPDRT